jgi:hypothetical protein
MKIDQFYSGTHLEPTLPAAFLYVEEGNPGKFFVKSPFLNASANSLILSRTFTSVEWIAGCQHSG